MVREIEKYIEFIILKNKWQWQQDNQKKTKRITKAVIGRLKKSTHYLHSASMLIRKLHTDKQKIKDDTDFLGYTGVDIEDLMNEYKELLKKIYLVYNFKNQKEQ